MLAWFSDVYLKNKSDTNERRTGGVCSTYFARHSVSQIPHLIMSACRFLSLPQSCRSDFAAFSAYVFGRTLTDFHSFCSRRCFKSANVGRLSYECAPNSTIQLPTVSRPAYVCLCFLPINFDVILMFNVTLGAIIHGNTEAASTGIHHMDSGP